MTTEKLLALVARYDDELARYQVRPQRLDRAGMVEASLLGFRVRVAHLRWMLATMRDELVPAGRIDKAMRWLGFVQGFLWASGMTSIGSLKHDARPEGEAHDPMRV